MVDKVSETASLSAIVLGSEWNTPKDGVCVSEVIL